MTYLVWSLSGVTGFAKNVSGHDNETIFSGQRTALGELKQEHGKHTTCAGPAEHRAGLGFGHPAVEWTGFSKKLNFMGEGVFHFSNSTSVTIVFSSWIFNVFVYFLSFEEKMSFA